MIRVTTRKRAILVLLALLILPAARAGAGDQQGPSSKEVKQMIEFGISLGKQGLWKEALYRWQEALRYDPDNPKLLNNIAVALESQGDLEGARDAYARAQELAGRARYIKRNIEDFEELFTALEQYEAQFKKPPEGEGENADAAGGEDGDAVEGDASEGGEAAEEADESGAGPVAPADEQPVEEAR